MTNKCSFLRCMLYQLTSCINRQHIFVVLVGMFDMYTVFPYILFTLTVLDLMVISLSFVTMTLCWVCNWLYESSCVQYIPFLLYHLQRVYEILLQYITQGFVPFSATPGKRNEVLGISVPLNLLILLVDVSQEIFLELIHCPKINVFQIFYYNDHDLHIFDALVQKNTNALWKSPFPLPLLTSPNKNLSSVEL